MSGVFRLLFLIAMPAGTVSSAAGVPGDFRVAEPAASNPPGDSTVCIAPFRIEGPKLVVPAGVYDVAGVEVRVSVEARLPVDPADIALVAEERLFLSKDRPGGFFTGTLLQAVRAANIGAFNSLIDESVVVWGEDGRRLQRDEDYLLSAPFALLGLGPRSVVTADTPVRAAYSYYLQRIDAVVVDAKGAASLIRGSPRVASPDCPPAPDGAVKIATVYRPFRATSLDVTHVFPITARAEHATTATNRGRMERIIRKFRTGESATIVCWGDSIAVGADVAPADAWANRFRTALGERFPNSIVRHVNLSIGGSKSVQWLNHGRFPGMPDKNPDECRFDRILAESPDLVVMEFLNDVVLSESVLHQTYRTIHAEFASRGIEWLIVTPSQRVPQNFDLAEMKDGQPRLLDTFLRRFAADHGHALADAAARWKHLHREGIPYFALFNNAYNHPNAEGHRLFVEEIMRCFEE